MSLWRTDRWTLMSASRSPQPDRTASRRSQPKRESHTTKGSSMTVATSPAERISPAERLNRVNRLKQLLSGTVRIPLTCTRADCGSSTLDYDRDLGIRCWQGGHTNSEHKMRDHRQQRIARYLRTGEVL